MLANTISVEDLPGVDPIDALEIIDAINENIEKGTIRLVYDEDGTPRLYPI